MPVCHAEFGSAGESLTCPDVFVNSDEKALAILFTFNFLCVIMTESMKKLTGNGQNGFNRTTEA